MINKSENSFSKEDGNNIHSEANKHRVASQDCNELSDKILEIRQIEYEQYLLVEEMNRVDAEKQRLQHLLNLLKSTKSNDRTKNTKYHHHYIKRTD
jgi:hypothetical protein